MTTAPSPNPARPLSHPPAAVPDPDGSRDVRRWIESMFLGTREAS